MKVTAILPARYASTRFEGKPLADILGKPMIQHVYERVKMAKNVENVLVATDDQRIFDAVAAFGGEVLMTSSHHPTGTDRLAEVAAGIDSDFIVNVQGDEPLIQPEMIDEAIAPMIDDPSLVMGTLKCLIKEPETLKESDIVKVVVDKDDFALYFSRFPIPFVRDESGEGRAVNYFRHIGLYVYKRQFLLDFAAMKPSPLENAEKLEQLRALENGFKIKVVTTDHESIGVDRPEDLEKVKEIMKEMT
ncbi:MAG: 3-deoxy-manno-octulosonate cytidylyltransferase [Deltaproteobacteria bacterium]|nr:3-deoxy-manno-octulosonate cytidylyltransferase [Deltaproteobacteria bacterium]